MDIPYASPPQGMKYFTIIGPHIDCMEEQYLVRHVYNKLIITCRKGSSGVRERGRFGSLSYSLFPSGLDDTMNKTTFGSFSHVNHWYVRWMQKPLSRRRKRTSCCLCCKKGPLSLSVQVDRSAYVSGESLRLKADINNRSAEDVRLRLRLVQVSRSIHLYYFPV